MLTWDKVVHVDGPDGAYVVRAGPEGRPAVMTPPYGALFYYLWEKARQMVRREPWTVTVQHADDFPCGPSIWAGACPSRRFALRLLRAIGDDLRVRGLTAEASEVDGEGSRGVSDRRL